MRPFLKKILLHVCDLLGINAFLGVLLSKNGYLVGYHSIASSETGERLQQWRYPHVSITAEVFKKQLEYLERKGHTFVSLNDLYSAMKAGVQKPTVIYFDDGYKDTLETALPILKERGIPAVVFLVTDLLDGSKRVLPGFKPSEDSAYTPFLDWDGAKELLVQGAIVGSHTVSHPKLVYCSDQELQSELAGSKRLLEEKLGVQITAVSYPHGRVDKRVATAAKVAGYAVGFTTREGINTLYSAEQEPMLLAKVEPRPEDSLSDFRAKVYSAGALALLRGK